MKQYKFKFRLENGSKYYYESASNSSIEVKKDEETIKSVQDYKFGLNYFIEKDFNDCYLITVTYRKIYIHTKSGENETEVDSENPLNAPTIIQKIFDIIKKASLKVKITSTGKVLSIYGYDELSKQVIDTYISSAKLSREIAKKQWDQMGNALMGRNLEQIFTILPDSGIKVGDNWTKTTVQKGELNFLLHGKYEFSEIKDDLAVFNFRGDMTADSTGFNMLGYTVNPQIKGDQEGVYKFNMTTGMMEHFSENSIIKGSLEVLGKNIPIQITSSTSISGGKVE